MAKQGLIARLSLLFLCFNALHANPFHFSCQCRWVSPAPARTPGGKSPFTPKAYLIRYWNSKITNNRPKPDFLISKASPLTAVDAAAFAKLAGDNCLSEHLPAFCAAADLLCFPEPAAKTASPGNPNFSVYHNKNFTNYGAGGIGRSNEFKNYSNDANVLIDTFRSYSRRSVGNGDRFRSYGVGGNFGEQRFNTYGKSSTGGSGGFRTYNTRFNDPNLRFTSYSTDGIGRDQRFETYNEHSNAGNESFTSYGRHGDSADADFTSYSHSANVIESRFNGYGKDRVSGKDTFRGYGDDGNVPLNEFRSYGGGGNGAVERFSSYRVKSNVGDDSFQSYAEKSNHTAVDFRNYGKSIHEGTDQFSGYGKGASSEKVGFRGYGTNNTFKDYADKRSVTFAEYSKKNQSSSEVSISTMADSGKTVNRWVEPGRFFREASLKSGTVMPMPNIRDATPKRSFLPRAISSKLPFATAKLPEMKRLFHAEADGSKISSMFGPALADCEREPSRGETKRCVGSIEDMIDFATTILGLDVVVRSTENTNGSDQNIMIGTVRGINGGDLTESVSCHQTLYPYMLYYCHSVPKVRVYEADILDPTSRSKINHGVAICHVDTTSWSATHGAFVALGSGPGKIEVCHWIFEGDMTWVRAD